MASLDFGWLNDLRDLGAVYSERVDKTRDWVRMSNDKSG